MSDDKVVTQAPRPFLMTTTSNQWSSDLFDCCQDKQQCCFAFWCAPVFACMTAKEAGECLCLPLLDYLVGPAISLTIRVSVRQRYGIEGDIFKDCLIATYCGICSWCQVSREIKTRSNPITFVAT